MKHKFRLAAAAVSIVLCLTSCVGSELIPAASDVTVRFSWWFDDIGSNSTATGVEQFIRINPDIDVYTDFSEYEAYAKRVSVSHAAGNEPDVMKLDYGLMYRLSESGNGLYDLYDLSEHIDLTTFTQDDLSYGTVDGKLIGLPISLDTETFFYNKDIYDRYGLSLPENWNDIFHAAAVMRSGGIYPVQMDKTAAWLSCIAYQEQLAGKRCFDRAGGLQFEQDDFCAMLTFYKSLVDGGVMKHYSEVDEHDFRDGTSAGVLCWISEEERYCKPLVDKGSNIVLGRYLRNPGSMILGWYARPTGLYCIKKNTVRPTESAKLINFLVNSQEMAQLQETTQGIPLSRAMLEALEANGLLKGLKFEANVQMSNSREMDNGNPCYEDDALLEAFERAVEAMLYEGKAPEELAEALCTSAWDVAFK